MPFLTELGGANGSAASRAAAASTEPLLSLFLTLGAGALLSALLLRA
eukprot:COSAG04_NODE_12067_length_672_cov_1.785340_1_plen_46_part_10